MKTNFLYSLILLALATSNTSYAQNGANRRLSNLTTVTKINSSLLPDSTHVRNLGSASNSWKNIYVKGAYYLDGDKFINNSGIGNTFIGSNAGSSNTTGIYNTTNGANALYNNTTGIYNTANGANALYNNTTGFYNATNGAYALYNNTTGFQNTTNGAYALYYNTTGAENTANGSYALRYNTTGAANTANGVFALSGNITGNYNTANGFAALSSNTTGNYNTANGVESLDFNTTGNYNTSVGYSALTSTTVSEYNTSVGYYAGSLYNNGDNNIFVGAFADVNGGNYYNDIAIGQGAVCTASSETRIGNPATVSIGGYTNWSNISDGRVKRNIKQNVPGLAFINKLQPITYNLDLTAADNIVQAQRKDSTGKIIPLSNIETSARKAKEQIIYTGFVAQDVEKSAKDLNYDFSGVDAAKNSKDLYGLRYAEFVVPLVKAVQELSGKNDSLKQNNDDLKSEVENLKSQMEVVTLQLQKMENAMSQCCSSFSSSMQSNINNQPSTKISDAPKLEQNIPNPFNSSSSISYYIPSGFHNAQLMITDASGHTLKTYTISSSGNGKQIIYGNELISGMYQYSLWIDGKLIHTKKMVLTK
ncbi:MAG: tail fiber domain-containing protein [Chitinophagaceae bacterium]